MMVVPCGLNVTVPLLGCGPAVLCGVAEMCGDASLLALPDAEAEAGVDEEPPDAELVATAVLEAVPEAAVPAVFELDDDPPHAASSSTSDPRPVAAAHPLLRIISPISHG
jgi:hypothetical protein